MAEKYFYGYSNREWLRLVVCYVIFFLFGGIESSEGVYYGLMKTDLQIPYSVQGYLVSMNSWAFVLGSPLLGVLMTYVNVKPILVGGFVAYLVAYCVLFKVSLLWVVFIFLFHVHSPPLLFHSEYEFVYKKDKVKKKAYPHPLS